MLLEAKERDLRTKTTQSKNLIEVLNGVFMDSGYKYCIQESLIKACFQIQEESFSKEYSIWKGILSSMPKIMLCFQIY